MRAQISRDAHRAQQGLTSAANIFEGELFDYLVCTIGNVFCGESLPHLAHNVGDSRRMERLSAARDERSGFLGIQIAKRLKDLKSELRKRQQMIADTAAASFAIFQKYRGIV